MQLTRIVAGLALGIPRPLCPLRIVRMGAEEPPKI
jgi:hypothetical protein